MPGHGLATSTLLAICSVKENSRSIVTALRLARATMTTLRQNPCWAFGYNVVLIPLAIAYPAVPFLREQAPIVAAAALALSSVTSVSDSLRLRRFRRTA
jgi:Cu+-exporting ATPase